MKRIHICLDDLTHERLRRQAFERGCSISSYARELLSSSLATARIRRKTDIKDFTFIGAGRSRQGKLSAVSEHHDEALTEALMDDHCR